MGVKRYGLPQTPTTEYNHKNICRGTSNWWNPDLPVEEQRGTYEDFLASTRDFNELWQMNNALVNGINTHVAEDDYLVHLGDWSFGGAESIWEFRKQINCKNITFILGNHDHHIANNRELPNLGWEAQSIFDSVHAYLELVVSSPKGKTTYNTMHFPIAIWNKAHHDRIMLHGHCHSGYQHPGRSLDVGVDQAFKLFGEYRPFSQDDIRRFMNKREFKKMDHHDKGVN